MKKIWMTFVPCVLIFAAAVITAGLVENAQAQTPPPECAGSGTGTGWGDLPYPPGPIQKKLLMQLGDKSYDQGWANAAAEKGQQFFVAGSRWGRMWVMKVTSQADPVWQWPGSATEAQTYGTLGVAHAVLRRTDERLLVGGWDGESFACSVILLSAADAMTGEGRLGGWHWLDTTGFCGANGTVADGPKAGLAIDGNYAYFAANDTRGGIYVVKLDMYNNAPDGSANVMWQETYNNSGLSFQGISVNAGKVAIIGENSNSVHIATRSVTGTVPFAGMDIKSMVAVGGGEYIKGLGSANRKQKVLLDATGRIYAGGQSNGIKTDAAECNGSPDSPCTAQAPRMWMQRYAANGTLEIDRGYSPHRVGASPSLLFHDFDLVNLCAYPWWAVAQDGANLWLGGFSDGAIFRNTDEAEAGTNPAITDFIANSMAYDSTGKLLLAGRRAGSNEIRIVVKAQRGDCGGSVAPGPGCGGSGGGGGAEELPPDPPPPSYVYGGSLGSCEWTAGPNPLNLNKDEYMYMTWTQDKAMPVTIRIFDSAGVLVRSVTRDYPAGNNYHYWRGTNQSGDKVIQGMYWVYINGCRKPVGVTR